MSGVGVVTALPMGQPRSLRRSGLFLIVIVLSELTPALPHTVEPAVGWWLVSIAFVVAMIGVGYVGLQRPRTHWINTLAPLLLYPAIHALRCADGNSTSGFTPLIFLPVIWFALYGKLRDVLIAVVLGAVTVFGPLVVVGRPQYPPSSWRGSLLLVIITATIGPLVYRLVESTFRANRALGRSESEFRAAFENAPTAMAITGLHGKERYTFVRVNHALCEMFGRSAAELTSRPVAAFTYPEDLETTANAFRGAVAANGIRIEKRYVHKSGRTIFAAVTSSVVHDDRGEPSHLITQIADLGQRRESDQALLDAYEADREVTEQLKQLDKVRAEMASTVSHELRTPLTSAAGYVELLVEGDAGPLTDEQRAMLSTVSRSLARLDGIVGDVLDMANSKTQDKLPTRAGSDIGAVVRAALDSVGLQAAARGQTLAVDTDECDGVMVVGEAGRLERMLINLLTNAIKFTPEDGTVTVSADRVPDLVVISVADSGVGISTEDQARIFERFFRADRVVEAMTPGTGLGLSIVQAIVTQYGGSISVRSELGEGSTFTLTLPVKK